MKVACSSCGAPIRWCVTDAGKRMPLDGEPVSLRPDEEPQKLIVVEGGIGRVVEGRAGFRSHFATCKQAGYWRRKS